MKKLIALFLPITLLLVACDKDKAVVKNLEGAWSVAEIKEAGTAIDTSLHSRMYYNFKTCDLSDEKNWCSYEIWNVDSTILGNFWISEKGSKLQMTQRMKADTLDANIVEHSADDFIFNYKVADIEYQYTLKKRKEDEPK
jgi:hypothetical protein